MANSVYTSIVIPLSLSGTIYNAYGRVVSASMSIEIEVSGTVDNPGVYEMTSSLTLPSLEVSSTGLDESIGLIPTMTIPALTLSATTLISEVVVYYTGDIIALPVFTLDAYGYNDEQGVANLLLPVKLIDSDGILSIEGTASVVLPSLIISTLDVPEIFGTASLDLPRMFITGMFGLGAVGTFDRASPSMRLYGVGNLSAYGSADLMLPSLSAVVLVESSGSLAICMNVENKALTTYSSYVFNSFCLFKGLNLAAKADGVYLLGGNNDNTAAIEWNFKTGLLDLEQAKMTKLHQAWFGYKTDGDLLVTLILPTGQSYEYDLTSYDESERSARVKFGKGVKTRYLSLDVSSVDGHTIDLDMIKLHLNRPSVSR